MKVIIFDPIPGTSGDMILAALIDCGVPRKFLVDRLSFIPGFAMKVRRVTRHGVSGQHIMFNTTRAIGEKRFLPLIKKSSLSQKVKQQAIQIIERIFEIERRVHRAKHLHLHELADADTLLDICGALIAIEHLAVDKIISRPLKAGKGFIQTVEGKMPAFNFATSHLLKGSPVDFLPIPAELTTPTGAAIISTIASFSDSFTLSKIDRIGLGMGTMNLKDRPNCMRIFVGSQEGYPTDVCTVFETNIDDMNPQDYGEVTDRLYRAGALEVMITPTIMKKTRPGVLITTICQENQNMIRDILLRHTTTLGLRMYETKRWKLRRTIKQVSTPLGKVRVKIAWIEDEMNFTIEYKDLERIAHRHRQSLPGVRTKLNHFIMKKLQRDTEK